MFSLELIKNDAATQEAVAAMLTEDRWAFRPVGACRWYDTYRRKYLSICDSDHEVSALIARIIGDGYKKQLDAFVYNLNNVSFKYYKEQAQARWDAWEAEQAQARWDAWVAEQEPRQCKQPRWQDDEYEREFYVMWWLFALSANTTITNAKE